MFCSLLAKVGSFSKVLIFLNSSTYSNLSFYCFFMDFLSIIYIDITKYMNSLISFKSLNW